MTSPFSSPAYQMWMASELKKIWERWQKPSVLLKLAQNPTPGLRGDIIHVRVPQKLRLDQ